VKLEEILAPVSSDLEAVESYLCGWADGAPPVVSDAVGHIIRSGGKRLRPACLLLAAGLGPDTDEDERRIELAAAVEIIHTASLVHDDIIDGAAVRRNSPTLHARWGQAVALLVGDLLYARVFRQLTGSSRDGALRVVAETVHRMVVGELMETLHRDDLDLGEEGYFDIIASKTASLFSCATSVGARVGGLCEEDSARLRRYGEHLGNAFQIVDDVLDVCEEEAGLGKPAGADLREGNVTLPVIHALARDRRLGRQVVSRLFSDRNGPQLRAETYRGGSLSYAVGKAEEATREAVSCLEGLPEGPCLRGLVGMAGHVASRGRKALQSQAVAGELQDTQDHRPACLVRR
jgi:geranylgeranyl pyrophosphate synthase